MRSCSSPKLTTVNQLVRPLLKCNIQPHSQNSKHNYLCHVCLHTHTLGIQYCSAYAPQSYQHNKGKQIQNLAILWHLKTDEIGQVQMASVVVMFF